MKQQWQDLLFLHWEADLAELRQRVPADLEIDTYQGQAYIALVPFNMKGVTGRFCPAPAALCDFPEFNVRTYVIKDGKPGVYFFSLDITNKLAVWAARTFFHLPYRTAQIEYERNGESISYSSQYSESERFSAQYKPTAPYQKRVGDFASWATERYCLYTHDRQQRLYRGEIQHPSWPLQTAEVTLEENTMLDSFTLGKRMPDFFASSIDVVVYALKRTQKR